MAFEALSVEQEISPLSAIINRESGDWPDQDILQALCYKIIGIVLNEIGSNVSGQGSEVSILFTDDAEVAYLNKKWRGKEKSTNVLSFPCFTGKEIKIFPVLLGDVVLAYETVESEARAASIPFIHHIAHLIVHGFLHLLGFDHEKDQEAEKMEALEIRVLTLLDIPNPYNVR